MLDSRNLRPWFLAVTFLTISFTGLPVRGQGITLTGVGPINRSMGGAGTAAPLDAIGAIHWNPGSISGMACNEVSFGFEALLSDIELSSTVGGVTNTTNSEPGVAPIPSVGWVHRREGSPVSLGLGLYGIAGFRLNHRQDPANLVLASGPIFADAEFLQLAPTVAVALTDRLSVGISPTVTLGKVTLDPLGPSVITPDPTPGSGNRVHWGGGVQAGVYYVTDRDWQLGFTFKSRQFFEEFRFFTPTRVFGFDMDYPMILSLGAAYTGLDRWVFALDARYFDFANTPGFRELGWSNVFAMAVGTQYQLNDCWYVRLGYNHNQNPISSMDAGVNLSTPLIQEHNVAAGLTYRFA